MTGWRVPALAAATLLALAGCAALPASDRATGPGVARTPDGARPAPQAAAAWMRPGQSTRDEVQAKLGPAIVIPFDSGHAVWVYRWPGAEPTRRSATELVLLFDPAGVLTKWRIRPGVPPIQ